jgi:hypothetical protein
MDSPRIIGFGHLARVGKDSAAEVLVRRAGYRRLAFADPLKAVALDVFPTLRERVETWGWDHVKSTDPSVRPMLQRLGAAVRDHVGVDTWLDAAFASTEPGCRYVISDVRFENEAKRILDRGGAVYRIDRPGVAPANDHISELALADWTGWTGVILNDGTLADLEERVLSLVGGPVGVPGAFAAQPSR